MGTPTCKLLTPPTAKPQQGLLAPQPEPLEQNLLIDSCAPEKSTSLCRALDKTVRFGQTYEYRAQRVVRVTVDGKTLELAGEISGPVRVEALDVFPPESPTGLAAVGFVIWRARDPMWSAFLVILTVLAAILLSACGSSTAGRRGCSCGLPAP